MRNLWQRVLKRYGNSQTVVWAKAQQLVGVVGCAGMYVAYAFDGLSPYMISPVVPEKYQPLLPLVFWVLGKVTEIARKRPGSDDPVEGSR